MNEFGENLRRIRLEKGMSQDEFAKFLGTSKQVISRYETNQRSPKISVVANYSEKLGVSLSELTGNLLNENTIRVLHSISDALTPPPLLKQIGKALSSSPELNEMNRAMLRMTSEERQKMIDVGKALFPDRFTDDVE